VTAPALEVEGLHKNFGTLAVARNVNLALARGARHALIGPNGAGKTTLVHLIAGLLRPSAGRVRLDGVDVTHAAAERRVALGLARTFQINSLFPRLSVAENIGLAVAARSGLSADPWRPLHRRPALLREVGALLEAVNLRAYADRRIANLAYGQRRLVEVALALALEPKVLLLDEPAAGLSMADSEMLLGILLRRLPEDMAVLVIEHDMALVFRFARTMTVMVEGGILTEGSAAEVRQDPRVRDVYLGRRHIG
jgi:branched-chain amino acid transport system ATP-binding protein